MPKKNKKLNAPHKKVDMKKSFGRLFKYLKVYMPLIIVSITLIIVSAIIRLIGPNKLGELTDMISKSFTGTPFKMSQVWKIATTLISLYVFSAVCTYIANFLIGKVCFALMGNKLRKEVQEKINRIPLKYIDKVPYGDVLSVVTNDIDTIGQTLHTSVASLVGAVVLFIGSLLMMFVTNWIMALCAIASTIIGFSLMSIIIKNSQKYFVEQQKRLAELDGVIEEVYSGQSVIRVYNATSETKDKFENVNKKLYTTGWRAQFFSGVMRPLMAFIGNLGYVVVCIVGAILFAKGKIGFGVITSFMIYIRLFTNPLSQIAQAMTSVQMAAAESDRVFSLLDAKELDDESHKNIEIPEIKGNVEISNVKFGYSEDKEIIHDFSVKIKAGQKVAIVGPTGAGKTTIVNLLMRFYEVNSGDIKIDGISIKDMRRDQLRNIFSMVLQDTWLFEGTIRENLVYNKENVSEEMLDAACKACGLDHFIKTLSNGYDTILSDETSVSVGQKQLLTIARAMIQNSPMLILDEATSNVDTRTEEVIQKAMDKLTENRTSFVIAHRLSTIKNADVILVLRNGDVVESGNHKELIKKGGFYADLYNSQFSLAGCDPEEV